jgi:predicted acylesterase/phospholipase RssA
VNAPGGEPASACRRAVVFSGGGAKGVFESGVLHALHRIGYEPDVITGSSVGAINATAYAEIVRARRHEGDAAAEERMEKTLRLWQSLDKWQVADLDRWGRRVWLAGAVLVVGALALVAIALGPILPVLAGDAAWSAGLWLAARLVALAGVLLGLLAAWVLVAHWLALPGRLRRRVRRGMTGSSELTRDPHAPPSAGERRLLRILGVHRSLFDGVGLEDAIRHLVPEPRRFGDYRKADLDLRLTRTNLRTGRTEVSERVTSEDLVRPGAERGRRVLGDPHVVPATLASAAFPAAFPTVPAERLYPASENADLYAAVAARAHALRALVQLFGPRAPAELIWLHTLLDELAEEDRALLFVGREGELFRRLKERFLGDHTGWLRVSTRAVDLLIDTRHWPDLPLPEFSDKGDRYFDGGILDNTPLSTALAALRDRQAADETAGRTEAAGALPVHEVVVVLVSPPPRRKQLTHEEADTLEGPAVGLRALRLQAEQRLASDARTAERIDRLLAARGAERGGERGAERGGRPGPRAEAGAPPPRLTLDVAVRERLARVAVTRVVPSWDLPWVLALDDRLGFHAREAEAFQARGCRDALQALARGPARRRGAGGREPARHERRAAGLIGEISPSGTIPPGWICHVERCVLRSACDRVAAEEAKAARDLGEAAASSA